ncbi:hypothetical protein ABIB25_005170 [Nakamurella sp. UYEF19]
MPSFTIDSIDVGQADLVAQLPVEAELTQDAAEFAGDG